MDAWVVFKSSAETVCALFHVFNHQSFHHLNLIVGGFISSQRAAESVSLDAWVPENEVVAATHAVLTTFRDYGHRGNRQKCRMMWLIDEMGLENFRAEVQSRMPSEEMARGWVPKPAAEMDSEDVWRVRGMLEL